MLTKFLVLFKRQKAADFPVSKKFHLLLFILFYLDLHLV